MYAFLKATVCVITVAILCAGTANAAVTFIHQYNLGESDPGAAIGNVGNDPTIDSIGGLHLTRYGAPTYVAGSGALGSTIGMDFVNPYGYSQTQAQQYYYGSAPGVMFDGYNWGVDFWLKVNSYPSGPKFDLNQNYVQIGGYGGSYLGNTEWCINFSTAGNDGNRLDIQDLSGWRVVLDYTPPIGQWIHIAYVNKTPLGPGQDDGNAHVYIDGVEYSAYSQVHCMPFMWKNPQNPIASIPNKVTIGAFSFNGWSPTGFYRGANADIDSLRIFTFAEGQFRLEDLEIPEPGTLALLVVGLTSVLFYVWRKRK